MKKCYKELARQKLTQHKLNGSNSTLSVFEAAQLFDVITGKASQNVLGTKMIIENINWN